MDTDELLTAALDGQPDAGPLLVSVFGRRLLGYVRAAFPDLSDTDVEVICERAVERAVERLDRFQPKVGSFDAWLRGFARHEVLSLSRHPEVTARVEFRDDMVAATRSDSSDSQLEDTELTVRLQKLIRRLAPTDQLIVALRDIEQLPYATIAERLGDVQPAACRQRHARAIARLRELAAEDPVILSRLRGATT